MSVAGVKLPGAAVVLAIILASCAPKGGTAPRPAPPLEGPMRQVVADAQALRLDRLLPLKASGQVELRWSDDRGDHFEFCRGDLYVQPPADVALDLRKAGERFMYLGCDAERGWVFAVHESPRRLTTWRHGSPGAGTRLGGVTAFDLVDLAGLGEWTVGDGWSRIVDGVLVFEAEGLGGPLRIAVDPVHFVPVWIEALDARGEVRLRSELDDSDTVDVPGLPAGGLPRMPARVRITAAAGSTRLLLALGTIDPQSPAVRPGLFEYDRLVQILRPEVIDELDGGEE